MDATWGLGLLLSLLLLAASSCRGQEEPSSDLQSLDQVDTTTAPPLLTLRKFELTLVEQLTSQNKSAGDRLTLVCEIIGFPVPIYTWYKDGRLIDSVTNSRYQISLLAYGNRLRINKLTEDDGGAYMCRAENAQGVVNTTALVRVRPAQRGSGSDIDFGLGGTNKGSRGGGDNADADNAGAGDIDEEIDPFCQDYRGTYCGFLTSQQIYVTSRRDQANAEAKILDLVRDLTDINLSIDSECFKTSIKASCYVEMPVCRAQMTSPSARRLCRRECQALYPVCRPEFADDMSKWRLLPECSQLDNGPDCISIGLTRPPSTPATSAATSAAAGADSEASEESEGLPKSLTEIVLPAALGGALLVGIIVAVVCIVRKKKTGSYGSGTRSSSNGSHVKNGELVSLSDKGAGFVKEVTLDNVNMLQELGRGFFGTVYHGQAFGLYGNNTASAVYIKRLDEGYSTDQLNEFNEERCHMSDIRHQNILSLLAVSTTGVSKCLLYEYLQMGDLRLSILNQQSHGVVHSAREIMYMVTQIASSLEYLSIINFVHKDIAAHNVMMSHNLNVKLSTLKIIHGVHSANYCALHNRLLPLRWLPPETITYNRFSLETDVYSFGVFLWECFSVAQLPYSGYSSQEVIEMIRSRQLLPCPPTCPPRIYSLMMECWHESPSKRPTAKEVHQKLRCWYLDNTDLSVTAGGRSVTSASSTAPSQSSAGHPPSYPGHHSSATDATSLSNAVRPGYMQPGVSAPPSTLPYYSSIVDPYKKPPSTNSNSVSQSHDGDEMSEATESVVGPCAEVRDVTPPANYYGSSTPHQRFASLGRRKADPDFVPQTTPLFHATDQV